MNFISSVESAFFYSPWVTDHLVKLNEQSNPTESLAMPVEDSKEMDVTAQ